MLKTEMIKLEDLRAFIDSERYRNFETKPISKLRALSYLANPHAQPSDPVLILGLLDGELVAFRTQWRDKLYTETSNYEFGWCSGVWVRPDQRRKGIAKQLFAVAYAAWGGNLIATNLAPATRQQYLQTDEMRHFQTIEGYRFYRSSILSKILPVRYPSLKWLKGVYKLMDQLLNMGIRPIPYENAENSIQISDRISPIWEHLSTNGHLMFRRHKAAFQWLWRHPWMSSKNSLKEERLSYPFSLWAPDFQRRVVQVHTGRQDMAYGILIHRDRSLKLCYTSNFDSVIACQSLLQHILSIDFDYITIYDERLIDLFKRQRKHFLFAKPFKEDFFMSQPLFEQIQGQSYGKLYFGDGDTVFC